jgi:uncharacterized protein YjbI with pentapeptide repeats
MFFAAGDQYERVIILLNYKRPIIIMDVKCSKLYIVQISPFKGCNSLLSNVCLLFSGSSLSGSSLSGSSLSGSALSGSSLSGSSFSGISISSVAYSRAVHVNTFSSVCKIKTVLQCRSCLEMSGIHCDRKLSSIMIKSHSPLDCN